MKVYITVDENNRVVSCDTNNFGSSIEVNIEPEMLESMKILSCSYIDGQLVDDEEEYNKLLETNERDKKYQESLIKLNEITMRNTLVTLSDTDAYEVRYLYDEWKPDTKYIVGDRRIFGDILYKCKQEHTSQSIYTPSMIPALWDAINKDHQGTIDDPIPIPEPFSSMEYVKGKYYIENDVIYLMNREGMSDGETISLTFKPSQLIGHYFKVVE